MATCLQPDYLGWISCCRWGFLPEEKILGIVPGAGLVCTFGSDSCGSGAVAAWIFCDELANLDLGHWGTNLNNIHFSHEKRVAETSSLIGFFYEPIYHRPGVGSTNVSGIHPCIVNNLTLNTCYSGIAVGAELTVQDLPLFTNCNV